MTAAVPILEPGRVYPSRTASSRIFGRAVSGRCLRATKRSCGRFWYNTKRSGTFTFGNRRFVLRRVAFPENSPAEWFVVDLFEHAHQAAASPTDLALALARALVRGRFNRDRLLELARRYGSRATQALITDALAVGAS